MNIPKVKVVPSFTSENVSPKGYLNNTDVKKIIKNALIFFTPTITLYCVQLTGALSDHTVLSLKDLVPSSYVVGAFQGYMIATFIDYLKKLNSGEK